ncbi:neurotrimin-like [Bacillus rossius redtenbacheri]|uniref:neurotrimin-like n=1 Tax=Bacillus rossius redtenbacheri TaxID=93214 RepID=UPI002FDECBEE
MKAKKSFQPSSTSLCLKGMLSLILVTMVTGDATAQGVSGGSSDYSVGNVEQPAFLTVGRSYRIKTSDTVVLPCEVINPGKFVLAWKRGIAILTAGSVKVSPDTRLRLVDGYNLEIRDVEPQDAGDYTCQIGTMEPKEVTHTLEILVPPRIHQVTSHGKVEVKKGSTVTLECRASGNPVPTITWTRKNNLLPSGDQSLDGFSITIEQANRHHAGAYLCTAANDVGEPVTEQINLHVLYPPEIEVERSWVHSGEGYEAQLVCIVHAEPPAEMVWYRDTLRLDPTDRRIMEVRGSRRTLIIRKVQHSDFGNYTCVADNALGKARRAVELSGKPNRAVFRSQPLGRYKDSYNLTWSVNSLTPIEEFKLFYRRLPGNSARALPDHLSVHGQYKWPYRRDNETHLYPSYGIRGEWNDVILPAIPSELHTQQMSYLIKGLDPGAQYEAKVQAKNRFGWGHVSEGYQFVTRGSDNSLYEPSPEPAVFAEPEVRDLSMTVFNGPALPTCAATTRLLVAAMLLVAWT